MARDRSKKRKYYGVYLARVEENHDVLDQGRVRIRIPFLHGIPNERGVKYLDTDDLPWAKACTSHAGHDEGRKEPVSVGSNVWVMFEAGDPRKPVYIGGFHGSFNKKSKTMGQLSRSVRNRDTGGYTIVPGSLDTPREASSRLTAYEPTKGTVFKSCKGHTLCYEDASERESTWWIDRVGQAVGLIGPTDKIFNKSGTNTFKRFTRNAVWGTQFGFGTVLEKAVVVVKGLAGQVFRMVSQEGKEKVELFTQSDLRNPYETSKREYAGVAFESGKSDSEDSSIGYYVIAHDESTGNKVYIKGDAKNLKLELIVASEDEVVSRITLNDADISMMSKTSISRTSPSIEDNEEEPDTEVDEFEWIDARDERYIEPHYEYEGYDEHDPALVEYKKEM